MGGTAVVKREAPEIKTPSWIKKPIEKMTKAMEDKKKKEEDLKLVKELGFTLAEVDSLKSVMASVNKRWEFHFHKIETISELVGYISDTIFSKNRVFESKIHGESWGREAFAVDEELKKRDLESEIRQKVMDGYERKLQSEKKRIDIGTVKRYKLTKAESETLVTIMNACNAREDVKNKITSITDLIWRITRLNMPEDMYYLGRYEQFRKFANEYSAPPNYERDVIYKQELLELWDYVRGLYHERGAITRDMAITLEQGHQLQDFIRQKVEGAGGTLGTGADRYGDWISGKPQELKLTLSEFWDKFKEVTGDSLSHPPEVFQEAVAINEEVRKGDLRGRIQKKIDDKREKEMKKYK